MAKTKVAYFCQSCGAVASKWAGQCGSCNEWNTMAEEVVSTSTPSLRYQGYATATTKPTCMAAVTLHEEMRFPSGLKELDRVLGGGLVMGSVILTGGDPGIGKSTLLLQALATLSQQMKVLYVTGEESLQQVTLRARRLGLAQDQLWLLANTHVEQIIQFAEQEHPRVMVIDSIQTMHTDILQSAPGSVGQVRESAASLVAYAKQAGITLFLVGHVTKEGTLAGPRVLEHMVDTVLYFEGEQDQRYRVIRAVKNRFGAVNELGIFAMTDKGLREVNHPSALFLSRHAKPVPGSVIMCTREGTRPLLAEVQALVDPCYNHQPRRICVGLENQRLSMLLAVLHRHCGIASYDQDIFINVVGGIRILEPAADLPILFAILSSLRNQPLAEHLLVFGELGLAGEIRPVSGGQERLREAAKHGFKKAIVPHANAPKKTTEEIAIIGVQHLQEALDHLSTETT
ncbi:MAG: DNA repair protein RadA [Gammaproteobacteria bacterium RIFCSPHIGHO2_12_FULL_41_20]|nr:MAG: DNA repair protein RadA [Gammaproteobacteria bacterium RIFCSPHIGHO2_12_FULL_41_20]